jgi:protein-L-isoaspartate(D-aspartate) O-methyltransferase
MNATIDFAAARRAMLDSQLRTSGVNDPFVLDRMGAVAREDFVPEGARATAYIDRAIPLGNGRRLAAPLYYGMLLAEAKPRADDRVLLVDSGAGYLAELIRPLVATLEVVTPEDALTATRRKGDFTLLAIDGAVEHLPAALVKRLAPDARVVTGLAANGVTRLAIGRRSGAEVAFLPLAEIGIPRLGEFDRPKGWTF